MQDGGAWEIGGQNIPNEEFDIEEDKRFSARTIPVVYGIKTANVIIVAAVVLTLIMCTVIFYLSWTFGNISFILISLTLMVTIIGWYGASMTFPVEKD